MIPDFGDKYVYIVHNKATHISRVVMHVGTVDMHTFFHSHVRICFINMKPIQHYRVIIYLKDTTVNSNRPSVFRTVALVFEFFKVIIPP